MIAADGAVQPLSSNSTAYDAFHTAWWKQEEVLYSTTRTINGRIETVSEHIPLPWAPAATSNIPPTLFSGDGLTANEGWVMAYDLFAAETNGNPNSKPYFMLYNKYTGILRTFYYQNKDAGTGGEFSFVVTPDDALTDKSPYYHSLQYGIPVCNTGVQRNGNVLGVTRGNNSFQQYISPYLKADVVLKPGWYCFDLDLSAYSPGLQQPFQNTDRMSIDCMTANNTNITMAGTLTGSSEGTLEGMGTSSTASTSGMNYLNSAGFGLEGVASAVDRLVAGNYIGAVFGGLASIFNLGKALTGDEYDTESKSTGTINMSFTGELSLEGYSTSNASNNAIGVEFSYTAFSQNGLTGRGVWGLQDNPVVYVVKDRLIGEDEDLACVVNTDGYSTASSDPVDNNLRLFTFFDPTSIRFNLNTSLYSNISNVRMSWVYGVYPNQQAGHTDPYRNGLMGFKGKGLLDVPEFIDKKYVDSVYKSFSSGFANMLYVEWPLEDMATTTLDAKATAKIYEQAGADYRYYGRPGNGEDEVSKDFFVVDPVILLPTTYKKDEDAGEDDLGVGKFYDFVVPDLVVGVVLTFDYQLADGTTAKALLSKRFLPVVKSISSQELKAKRQELQDYVNNGTHQTLDGGIRIQHEGAGELLRQFFENSEYLQKYDNE